MKFEIEISEKDFKALKDELTNQDMDDDLNDEKYIIELFCIKDRHGNIFDLRDNIEVKKQLQYL